MISGDHATITSAHNQALRRLAAAARCSLGPPESSPDAATGHAHVDAAIAAIERAEEAASNTRDPQPTDAGPDHDAGIFASETLETR